MGDTKHILHDGDEMTVQQMKDEIHRLRKQVAGKNISSEEYDALTEARGDHLANTGGFCWVRWPNKSHLMHSSDVISRLVERRLLAWSDEQDGMLVITDAGIAEIKTYNGWE